MAIVPGLAQWQEDWDLNWERTEIHLEQMQDVSQTTQQSKQHNSLCRSRITDIVEQNGPFVQQNHIPNLVFRIVAEFNLREEIKLMKSKIREMKIFT